MNKNLSIVNQNNQLMLKKSKSLMSITNNILSKDDWMQRLWDWADENGIPDYQTYIFDEGCESFVGGIAREKDDLLRMESFSFLYPESIIFTAMAEDKLVYLSELEQWHYNQKMALPKEVSDFVYLSELESWYCDKKLILPKEISNLTYLTELRFIGCNIITIPKEIGDLKKLIIIDFNENEITVLPKEIGNLINLKRLYLDNNDLVELPKDIVNLINLTKLSFEDNPMLSLTESQQKWIFELMKNGCDVTLDDKYENLYGEFELRRRYEYLDEFNIGREVPITPEILDDIIPSRITNKLAEGKVTFEEYLDEVSDYLRYPDKEKFNSVVQKLYDRDYDLGSCFDRNISFVNFSDNKLTWKSIANGEDKKILSTHWGLINMYVKDTFGFETKIVNKSVTNKLGK